MSTGDEDQSLGDDSDLEVCNHMKLWIVLVDSGTLGVAQRHPERALEPRRFDNDDDECDTEKTSYQLCL